MAITALVLAFLGFTGVAAIVAIVLAIIVLLRSKDGGEHGKGLAISALVVSAHFLLAFVAIFVLAIVGYFTIADEVNEFEAGQCLNADGLTDTDADALVTGLVEADCDGQHVGEVVAHGVLSTADLEAPYADPGCEWLLRDSIDRFQPPLTYTSLSATDSEPGDRFICVAYNSDGTLLRGRLGFTRR